MKKNDKLIIFVLVFGVALMILPHFFYKAYENLMYSFGISIFYLIMIWKIWSVEDARFNQNKNVRLFTVVLIIGIGFSQLTRYPNGNQNRFLFFLGTGIVLFSLIVLLLLFIKENGIFRKALKDVSRLSEEDFRIRLQGYTDIQLLSIIGNASYRIRDKLPIVYQELLKRGLCDAEEAKSEKIHYISKDDWKGSDIEIWYKLSKRFLLVAGTDGTIRYNSLLIRISEIESIVFSKWVFIRPPFFRIYFKLNGKRCYTGLLSPSHVKDWKNAFESVGLKVEERIKSKNKGKEELSRVSQDSWDF